MSTFWNRVDATAGPAECWPWKGAVNGTGYGAHWQDGQVAGAHRMAWELSRGPIPAGRLIMHKCDNRVCCNPAHLVVGTHADNSADMVAKGRSLGGERSPHAKLSDTEAAEIIAQRSAGRSLKVLAEAYHVSEATISEIANRRTRQRGSVRFSPYFKAQRWAPREMAWQDIQRPCDTVEAALALFVLPGRHRVMEITMDGRSPVPGTDTGACNQ